MLLHLLFLTLRPEHDFPPYLGLGWLHFLLDICTPPPHFLEHLLHDDHVEKLPLTKEEIVVIQYFFLCFLIYCLFSEKQTDPGGQKTVLLPEIDHMNLTQASGSLHNVFYIEKSYF